MVEGGVKRIDALTEGGEGDGVQRDELPQRHRAFGQVHPADTCLVKKPARALRQKGAEPAYLSKAATVLMASSM